MSEPVTTVILTRHGHVEGIDPARFRGRLDLPLTPLGRRQADALRDRIARQWRPDAIHTSPLRRCVDTATAIAQPTGLVPHTTAALTDFDYGAWLGLSEDEVRDSWPEAWARWHDTPQLARIPGGDILRDLSERTVDALHHIVHAHLGQTVVIVAHDSVNRVLLLHALTLPLSHYNTIAQSPCGLNVLEFGHGRFKVSTLNESGHLLGL
jgi:broad specificity phosphatase PhoE